MLKKLGLPVVALAAMLFTPSAASARAHWGIQFGVGAPGYVYPYAYNNPYYDYGAYPAYPPYYYDAPYYGYDYVAPSFGLGYYGGGWGHGGFEHHGDFGHGGGFRGGGAIRGGGGFHGGGHGGGGHGGHR